MGGKRTTNANAKRRAALMAEKGTWTIWIGGMAFPFLFKSSAEEFIAEVVADYPGAEYRLESGEPG